MKNSIIKINHVFGIAPGVLITLNKQIPIEVSELAQSLRWAVRSKCNIDDRGAGWFYCESRQIVFLAKNLTWIASSDKDDVALMKAADILDGSDFSAIGNGIE